jgi:hypothetical protein
VTGLNAPFVEFSIEGEVVARTEPATLPLPSDPNLLTWIKVVNFDCATHQPYMYNWS